MIARTHRFHGYGSLRPVYQRGQTVRGPLLSLKFSPHKGRAGYRAAVVVSRKISKSAVTRNRIRRRIYESVRLEQAASAAPLDLIFTVFSDEVATLDINRLEKMVSDVLAKAAKTVAPTAGSSPPPRGIVKAEGK